MHARDRQAGRVTGRWLPAAAARLVWERIVRDDPELNPLVSPGGVARAAHQSWRRLHDYRIPPEALGIDESPETAAFGRWCRQYQRILDGRGWVDGALAATRLHALAAAPGLEVVGFDRLTPLQEALLGRWAEEGLEVRRVAADATRGTTRRAGALDAAAELDAAARWAAARLDGAQARRVAIVVPDLGRRRDEVRRIIERVVVPATGLTGGPLPEERAFELAAARPLTGQPVVGAALDLLDAFVRPPDLAALGRLLCNPFITGAGPEAAARARLDARIRRFEGPGLGLGALAQLAVERGCPVLADLLAGGQAVTSKWREKELPSNCSKMIFELLSSLGWPGTAPDSAEHQAAQRWRSLVSEFGACDEFTGRVSRAEAVGLLRDMAGRALFEPQELRAPLLLIDAETCAGMHFDALWVCGMDAAAWPPPAAPDPFLPRHLQVQHQMPGASADLAARDARVLLDRLLASAPEVILSVPDMADDAPVLPSPLLDDVEPLVDPQQWLEPRLAAAQFASRPALERRTDATLPPISPEEAARGGARLLELQAACPFRAQAEFRLGARALEQPGVGVDAAERGDLVHAALAGFWRALGDQEALRALDAAGLGAAVRQAVEAALAEARRGADDVMRHLLDLEADWLAERVLAMAEADRARPAFAVESVEQPVLARIGALTLELRPDRIDRLPDGTLAVIDYKTGANADVRAWLDERPRLPQLPAYVQALGTHRVSAVAFGRVRSGDTGYAGVACDEALFTGLRSPAARGWPREFATWDDLLGAWRRRLEALAAEYAAGDARLAPDPPRACEYCHLGALCRIAEIRGAAAREESGDD